MSLGLSCVVLTEAGPDVGLGHLVRCVALCDALTISGVACRIIAVGHAPEHVAGAYAVEVHDWRSPSAASAVVADADMAIVDSYVADRETYEAVAREVTLAAYLDDTMRMAYPSGIVVNANPAAATLNYPSGDQSEYLLGSRYQLLRNEFVDVPPHMGRESVKRLLVIAGGTDAAGVRVVFAAAAHAAYPHAKVDVVEEPRGAGAIRDAMLQADLAVSAAGQTLYELAATGTPAVAVAVADNQISAAKAFESAGALKFAGVWGADATSERILELLCALRTSHDRAAMSRRAHGLVDGRGATRVARILKASLLDRQTVVRHALAGDEIDLLLLANDPVVREASFSGERISSDRHQQWFAEVLVDASRQLLVARRNGQLVAQIRFDLNGADAVVSISITGLYRGAGLARRLLERAEDILKRDHPEVDRLVAYVKSGNQASRSLFENSGYFLTEAVGEMPADAVPYVKELVTPMIAPEEGSKQ